jgi:hypothetical protein
MRKINPFTRNLIIGILCIALILSSIPIYMKVERDSYSYSRLLGVTLIQSNLNGYRKKLYKNIDVSKFPENAVILPDENAEDMLFSKDDNVWCIIGKQSFLKTTEINKENAYLSDEDIANDSRIHYVDENVYIQDPRWVYRGDDVNATYNVKHFAPYHGTLKIQTQDYLAVIFINCSDPTKEECIKFVCETVINFINNNVIDITTVYPEYSQYY